MLKHHQQGIDIKDLYKKYDGVETEKKENYVPLDFYYKLVDYRKEIDTLRPPHSVLMNMGEDINSTKEDYGPSMGNVDYVLLFTSKRKPHESRNYNEDLFYALKVDGYWAHNFCTSLVVERPDHSEIVISISQSSEKIAPGQM